jgi:kynureninase
VKKSRQLTGYLEWQVNHLAILTSTDGTEAGARWKIVTPTDPTQRGAMLTLQWFSTKMLERVEINLKEVGVMVDICKPDLMRLSPCPLYNTFEDVHKFAHLLKWVINLVSRRVYPEDDS